MAEWKGRGRPLVIAVDFDGVCCRDRGIWQGVGKFGHPIDSTRRLLKTLREKNWVIIVWTTRGEVDLIRAWLEEHDFPFDYINENPYKHEWGSDKVKADIYLDDRAVRFVDDYHTMLNAIREIRRHRKGLLKWVSLDLACRYADEVREEGGKVVFTNGCFDLLHEGHIHILREAREQGNFLIVGINSDDSVNRLKGPGRPLLSQDARATVLAGLEFVDLIVVFDENTPERVVEIIRPDVCVKGADYSEETMPEAKIVKSYGGRIHLIKLVPGISTTLIAEKIRQGQTAGSGDREPGIRDSQ